MSIDWEELLDASGDELQDAYDALCDSEWEEAPWDDWEDDPWDDADMDEDDFDEEECREPRPLPTWEKTLDRVRRGLPVRDEHAVNVVRAMGAMPVTDYIDCLSPDDTVRTLLYQTLKRRRLENATYQQAADELYRVLMASERSKEEDEHCLDLLYICIKPIYQLICDLAGPKLS